MEEHWFYARDGAAVGPVDFATVAAFLSTHPDPSAVHVWRSDFTEWRTAGEIPEFNRFTLRPPPLPVKLASSAPSSEPGKMPEPVRERERSPEAAAPSQARSILGIVASIAALVVGAAVGKALGVNFWVPATLVAISYWAFRRMDYASFMVSALAFPMGHALWFLLSFVILVSMGQNDTALAYWAGIESGLLAGVLIWMGYWQSRPAFYVMLIYQVIAVGVNAYNLSGETASSSQLSLVAHLCLRVSTIGFAINALRLLPKPTPFPERTRKIRATIIGAVIGGALGFVRAAFDDPYTGGFYVPQTTPGWFAYYFGMALPGALVGAAIGYGIGRRRQGKTAPDASSRV